MNILDRRHIKLFKHKNGYFYYRFYDDRSKRLSRSTKQKTKSSAETFVVNLYKKDMLPSGKNILFSNYAENFWDWEKSNYIKKKKLRGTISRTYTDVCKSYLKCHILPFFKGKRLSAISKNSCRRPLCCERESRSFMS